MLSKAQRIRKSIGGAAMPKQCSWGEPSADELRGFLHFGGRWCWPHIGPGAAETERGHKVEQERV